MLKRIRRFYRNLKDRPWAFVVASLVVASATASLVGVGTTSSALDAVIPEWISLLTNLSYLGSGLLLLAGFGTHRGNVEAAGAALLGAGIITRLIVVFIADLAVIRTVDLLSSYILFVAALAAVKWRLEQLIHGERIVPLHKNEVIVKLRQEEDGGA